MEGNFGFKIAQALLILLILLIAPFAFRDLIPVSRRDEPRPQPATEADVRKVVDEAKRMAPDLSINEQLVPIIDRSASDKVLTYLVESKLTNEYWFSVTDYRLDYAGDWNKIDFRQLTAAIDRAYERHTSFADEITASVNIGVTGSVISGGLSVGAPVKTIAEALGLIRGVMKLDVQRVEIAIKGYADGEVSAGWHPPVPSLPAKYQTFGVLNPSNPDALNWVFYRKRHVQRDVAFPYRNADLPDLRAQFVRTEFVEPFVPKLANGNVCQVYVLHNKPLDDANQSEWRKAQIYVMVYLTRDAG